MQAHRPLAVPRVGRRPPSAADGQARPPGLSGGRLGEQVAAQILEQIAGGSVPPGAFLPSEAELADRYGISRAAVREALQLLASVSVISVLHGKGSVVHEESDWDVLSPLVMSALEATGRGPQLRRDLFEVRRILECAAAEMAAASATTEQRAAIAAKAATLVAEAASPHTPLPQFLGTDRDFHDLLAQIGGNLALRQIIRQVHVYVSASWTVVQLGPAERVEVAAQHKRISDAIVAGEPRRARAAMETHISYAERELMADTYQALDS
jgi:GntR family transcriptional regulator, transcriptional repressor for pyruvate dehydrogenase complex